MIVNMPNKEGVTLATQGKYCDENIEVVPTFDVSNTLNEYLKGTKKDITAEDLAGVTEIREYGFYKQNFTLLELPDGLKKIGANAFCHTNGFKTLTIPEGVIEIGNGAFQSSEVEQINLPNTATTLGEYAFSSSKLTSIVLPNGIISPNRGLFRGCNWLTVAILPETLQSISYLMFENAGLTTITIPASVTNISDGAFRGCAKLKEFICLSTNPPSLYHNAFDRVPEDCIFKVKSASLEAYKSETNWSVRADYIIALTPEEEALYGG